MVSTSKKDKIFFTKKAVLSIINGFIKNHKRSSFIIHDDEIYAMLADAAKKINPSLDWSTQEIGAIDIKLFFWRKYHIRYVPIIFGTEGDYYVFRKRKFFFF